VSVFERLAKRRHLPVGDTGLHVREQTFGEVRRIGKLDGDMAKTWLTLGFALVDAAGERLIVQPEGMSDPDFALLIENMLQDAMTPALLHQITEALTKLAKPVNTEALVKN
jgi:hypothetical protein